jgi:hypothetical protein
MSRASHLAAVGLLALVLSVGAPTPAWTATSTATPSGTEPATETLLDVPVDGLPTGFAIVAVERWTVRPGPQALTVPAIDGRVFVIPESGQITATQAGIKHQLVVGEPFTLADPDHQVDLHAPGPEDAVAWVVSLHSGASDPFPHDHGPHKRAVFIKYATEALPRGSGRLVLEQLTLAPESTLPPFEVRPLMWMGIGTGAVGVTLEGRTPVWWKSGHERVVRAGHPWPYIPNPMANPLMARGTQMTLRNASAAKTLVLYRLTLSPTAGDTPTAGTALGGTPLS